MSSPARVIVVDHKGDDFNLNATAEKVGSGDKTNCEATAARIYWGQIFHPYPFRRDPEGNPPNNLLNYGYAIIRGIVARSICSAGLCPAIGIHHSNKYNGFRLADDFMELFRPIVDLAVARLVCENNHEMVLNRKVKEDLITPLLGRFDYHGESRTLFDIANMVIVSYVAALSCSGEKIDCPDVRTLLDNV